MQDSITTTNQHYINSFIAVLEKRKKIALWVLITITVLTPLMFFLITYKETMSYGVEKLGIDRYQERITSATYHSLLLLVIIGSLMGLMYYIIHLFFDKYIPILKTLNNRDIEKLKSYNDIYSPFYQYTLPIIFNNNNVYIMTGTMTVLIPEHSLQSFELTKKRGRRYTFYQLTIQTKLGKQYRFQLLDHATAASMIKEDLQALL
ncbi:hypothetical protein HX052_17920 [Myroides marinus]|uniref:hypothetical protein n=1 Tax=Myroides marinus TaxID=703342 RepID=UPI0025786818|nr:hypothetical protein [Myroides marinus]MDM1363293.1 hypothetical protein [Myroides marinus]MDM1370327.1 hypothetical protein [Myroides marinus]MDM1372426.1 hypothetical protein [Myroides marinus]MDM1377345.1 hypothetical protein [Myroides marinus]MDM1384605.1 hypothetical protein [Myroides marinus]